ncbi:hypothetical protein J4772_08445 [Cohnella sp. LGH]|uniref:hypothetical protein n=1 Tax=Cohnella sp. LGH TaxID=1619153 RepID=UPI001ADD255C|nr:hypothetical protein [Cohnella sp. LGH]QTH44405.1 hypothetical protein J4772_08445 [Cohnella sp. LGH]
MRQGLIIAGLGLAVWAVPTLFFLLFGDWVLLEVGEAYFGTSLFLLEMLSFLLLIGLALIVRLRLIKERGSAARFGYAAAVIGLLLNAFVVWHRDSVFSSFTEGQHHAYAVWMTFAYVLTLVVPVIVDRFVREPAEAKGPLATAAVPDPIAEEPLDSEAEGTSKEQDQGQQAPQ